jgi:hypothetical protein
MVKTFEVELFDPNMKTYMFEVQAENYTDAVTQAMDKAFETYPDGQFALAGYKEIIGVLDET